MGACHRTVVRELSDFSQSGYAARGYLERIGVLRADRGPTPRLVPSELRVHTTPLFPPNPAARLVEYLLGQPAPDRGQTLDWPHQSS
jgi:hypothetical protein